MRSSPLALLVTRFVIISIISDASIRKSVNVFSVFKVRLGKEELASFTDEIDAK